jgi:vacuolar protein-sorting-associated protein 4
VILLRLCLFAQFSSVYRFVCDHDAVYYSLFDRLSAFSDEKNEKSKKTIKQKTAEYMARAEKLKQFLDKKEKPQAEGAGGGGGKKESDDKNDEKTKMQESLSGTSRGSAPN